MLIAEIVALRPMGMRDKSVKKVIKVLAHGTGIGKVGNAAKKMQVA